MKCQPFRIIVVLVVAGLALLGCRSASAFVRQGLSADVTRGLSTERIPRSFPLSIDCHCLQICEPRFTVTQPNCLYSGVLLVVVMARAFVPCPWSAECGELGAGPRFWRERQTLDGGPGSQSYPARLKGFYLQLFVFSTRFGF